MCAHGVGRAIIEVDDLSKHYGDCVRWMVSASSVAEGEILGLLGHNGAGKTTTIRMLTGRARPTSGRARIAGYDVVREREHVKPLINLVFEEQNLYERQTGRENLELFAKLYGAPSARVPELLERVGLTDAASRRVRTYSSGMKQRLLIARALGERSPGPVSRRTHQGAGPVVGPRRARHHPRPRARRRHDLPHHALHGRGGRAVRPRRLPGRRARSWRWTRRAS